MNSRVWQEPMQGKEGSTLGITYVDYRFAASWEVSVKRHNYGWWSLSQETLFFLLEQRRTVHGSTYKLSRISQSWRMNDAFLPFDIKRQWHWTDCKPWRFVQEASSRLRPADLVRMSSPWQGSREWMKTCHYGKWVAGLRRSACSSLSKCPRDSFDRVSHLYLLGKAGIATFTGRTRFLRLTRWPRKWLSSWRASEEDPKPWRS